MHINEDAKERTTYCYAAECNWNPTTKRYDKPSKCVGKLGEGNVFIPNRYFSELLIRENNDRESVSCIELRTIDAARKKYGNDIQPGEFPDKNPNKADEAFKTASIIHYGPNAVFGSITARYKIEEMLCESFGDALAKDILALAWYVTSEGSALSNNDSWLDYYENPRGCGLPSQEVTELLDSVSYDGIMTFYKLWLGNISGNDKVLYDLTSISYYGTGINVADWGYNRDHENLPQVNYALLCARDTAMPLFAWPLSGSISDVSTLEDTLGFLEGLGYKPNCLMMDRGFASKDNLAYLLRNGYTFLQALKVNAIWICEIIDAGEQARDRPDSMLKKEDRTYYVSTTNVLLVHCRKTIKKKVKEEYFFHLCKSKKERFKPQEGDGIEVIGQYHCRAHVLFCHDLVGSSHDRFMENLNSEYNRLRNDQSATVKHEYKPYFKIERPKYARKRTVDFNMDAIKRHKNKYLGYICFLENDPTIETADAALSEYSTRDYIEKDFDEMKNDLDMNRIRVHNDDRMRARLFIQFIAEIYLREIRLNLKKSNDCKKMTKKQIFAHIKAMAKIRFTGKYKEIMPQLSKNQRSILIALGIDR